MLSAVQMPGWLSLLAIVVGVGVALPIVSVATHLWSGSALGTWQHLMSTVLPEYVVTTLWLCLGVGVCAALLGVGAAWLVTHFDFPGRSHLEWALVLPLAMPAYVAAYAYTDLLQFSGPLQTWMRMSFGWARGDYWFPDVRTLGGAAIMLGSVLYPYVYMLTRLALLERGAGTIEAARSLGLRPQQVLWRVTFPMARPALVAGLLLVLMETLADYGTVSYFGVQTFTTGIYRAWFSLSDHRAAAQLAMCLLGMVMLVMALERAVRGHARFHPAGAGRQAPPRVRLLGSVRWWAFGACMLPLWVGFLLPVGALVHLALRDEHVQWTGGFISLALNSFTVAALAAVLAVVLALVLAYARRLQPNIWSRSAHVVSGVGYALPGSVIAVGLLHPLAGLDHAMADAWSNLWGQPMGLLLTGSLFGLIYAYLVRFLTAALQTVDSALHRITPHMEDSARSLGLSSRQTLGRVHLPLLRRGLLTAGLLVFIDVMKELPATLVMRPFNFDTLATQVYMLATDERLAEAAPSAIAIVVVGLLPMVILCRQIARDRR